MRFISPMYLLWTMASWPTPVQLITVALATASLCFGFAELLATSSSESFLAEYGLRSFN
jgi:hypothetical protein